MYKKALQLTLMGCGTQFSQNMADFSKLEQITVCLYHSSPIISFMLALKTQCPSFLKRSAKYHSSYFLRMRIIYQCQIIQ